MAFLRYDQEQPEKQSEKPIILVVLNFSNQIQKLALAHDYLEGQFTNVFSGLSFAFNKQVGFELMPGDYFVYVKSSS